MQNISCDKALTLSNLAWSEWTERLVIEIIIIVNVILLIMNAHSVLSKMKLSNIYQSTTIPRITKRYAFWSYGTTDRQPYLSSDHIVNFSVVVPQEFEFSVV